MDKNAFNFWQELPVPFLCLAPMEDVTDTTFRELVLLISDPGLLHVLFTEFTSTDGLCHAKGRKEVEKRLYVSKEELKLLKEKNVKLVAQIWGSNPEKFHKAAKYITENYTFDGIDINMGCPVKKIIKHGGCSALIKEPLLAKEIILATQEATNLPVSVKTRTGFNKHIAEEWIGYLLEVKPSAITLHGRTQHMDSAIPAKWEQIKKSVILRDKGYDTIIIGNGDVGSVEDAFRKSRNFGPEGIMIGRGIFANPWIFVEQNKEKSPREKLQLLEKHVQLFHREWKNSKNFNLLKRFFKIYLQGFDGAANLRSLLMNSTNYVSAYKLIKKFDNNFSPIYHNSDLKV